MPVYQTIARQFIQDIRSNKLTPILIREFENFTGTKASLGEVSAWQNSLPRVRDLLELAGLTDNWIALEYQIPYNKLRVDCMIFGRDAQGNDSIALLELKGWSAVASIVDQDDPEGNYQVQTYTGQKYRKVAHPSQQVKGYDGHLRNLVQELTTDVPLNLFSCAYCHNYLKKGNSGLFDAIYQDILAGFPVYTSDDALLLADELRSRLGGGSGEEVFNRFMHSKLQPPQKLLDSASRIIENKNVFYLLNEQLVARNLIWAKVRKASRSNEKSVIIVHGGPGTGKSLIAINLLAEAIRLKRTAYYACKSKPFLHGLRDFVGNNGGGRFTNLYRFLPNKMKGQQLDLLLVDEAHRIEKEVNPKYVSEADWSPLPQVDQLILCAWTSVFFIDDRQNVRSQEMGSSQLIREAAAQYKVSVSEITLVDQYRCMGSRNYLRWLEHVLGYTTGPGIMVSNKEFEIKIFDSPSGMYQILKEKEMEKPNSARMVAGFCWPWSNPDATGQLVNDVVIGDFAMPWEAKDGFALAKGIPQWYEWAYKTEGINQVGCIYTAQGFEFDYIGVIIGKDLVYDPSTNVLKADISATRDPMLKKHPANFETHVKNIYRVLMTRGMKGCYLYFVDKDTERYFRERME